MPEMPYTITRADEDIDVVLEYEIDDYVPAQTYGPPECCSPADGGCVTEITAVRSGSGKPIDLTTDEEAAAIEFVELNHELDDGYDCELDDFR